MIRGCKKTLFGETKYNVLWYFCKFLEHERPKKPSPALLTWKVVQQKVPWGLLFLLGGGFALAEGSKVSGMSEYIAHYLDGLRALPPLALLIVCCVAASTLTEFSSNVAIANIILPVLCEMVRKTSKTSHNYFNILSHNAIHIFLSSL